MSRIDENALPMLADPMARDLTGFGEIMEADETGGAMVPYGGMPLMQQTNRVTTAQRVAVPRDLNRVMALLAKYCAAFGDRFVYSWDVNDNQRGGKTRVEGGTIQLANTLVQVWGNCATDCDIRETDTHWIFTAFFMDYERGTTTSRLYQMRKKATMGGRYESDRALDMQFQIGQSKALRNAILNALPLLRDYAIEESRNNLVARFNSEEKINQAWAWIEKAMDRYGFDLKRIEAVRGRKRKDFKVPDLAQTFMEVRGIVDGMTLADEVFPPLGRDDEAKTEPEADKAKPAATRRSGGNKGQKDDGGNRAAGQSGGDPSGERGRNDSGGVESGTEREQRSEAGKDSGRGGEQAEADANDRTDADADDAVAGGPGNGGDGRDGGDQDGGDFPGDTPIGGDAGFDMFGDQ